MSVEPKLPMHWKALNFKINFRGNHLTINHQNGKTSFHWNGEQSLEILFNDQLITVNPSTKLNLTV